MTIERERARFMLTFTEITALCTLYFPQTEQHRIKQTIEHYVPWRRKKSKKIYLRLIKIFIDFEKSKIKIVMNSSFSSELWTFMGWSENNENFPKTDLSAFSQSIKFSTEVQRDFSSVKRFLQLFNKPKEYPLRFSMDNNIHLHKKYIVKMIFLIFYSDFCCAAVFIDKEMEKNSILNFPEVLNDSKNFKKFHQK